MKLSKNRINKLLKSKKQTRKKYNKKRKPAPKRKHKNTKNNKKIVNLRTKSLKRKPIRFYKSVESGGADGDGKTTIVKKDNDVYFKVTETDGNYEADKLENVPEEEQVVDIDNVNENMKEAIVAALPVADGNDGNGTSEISVADGTITDGDGSSKKEPEAAVAAEDLKTKKEEGDKKTAASGDEAALKVETQTEEISEDKQNFINEFMKYDGVEISKGKNETIQHNNDTTTNLLRNFNKFLEYVKDDTIFNKFEKSNKKFDDNETPQDAHIRKQEEFLKVIHDIKTTKKPAISGVFNNSPLQDEINLINNIQKLTNIETLTSSTINSISIGKSDINTILNEENFKKFLIRYYNNVKGTQKLSTNLKRILKKYEEQPNYVENIQKSINNIAGNLYDVELRYSEKMKEIGESNEEELAEDEKNQANFENLPEEGDKKSAASGEPGPETPAPAPATAAEQTDDKAQTPASSSTSTGDEADPIEPNIGEEYFIYKDGKDFKLTKDAPNEDTKPSVKVILNTGETEDDEIQYFSINGKDGFVSPDGKEAAMTMASSIDGNDKVYATSSLRKEFNNFVAEIKEALEKKDKDFGELKASIEQIIENQQQPPATSAETDTSNAEPAAEPAAEN